MRVQNLGANRDLDYPMASAPTGRILALESVRGIAAFAVVVSHLVMAFADPYPTGRPAAIETIPAAVRVPLELVQPRGRERADRQ